MHLQVIQEKPGNGRSVLVLDEGFVLPDQRRAERRFARFSASMGDVDEGADNTRTGELGSEEREEGIEIGVESSVKVVDEDGECG